MTALTLPTKHRPLRHFAPGLALTALLTGAALWAGSFPAIAGAGFQRPSRWPFYSAWSSVTWFTRKSGSPATAA